MKSKLLIFCGLLSIASCAIYNDRYKGYSDRTEYQPVEEVYPIRPVTHTFPNRTYCMEVCDVPCTITNVYMGSASVEMFNCARMRPPKISVLSSIKGNSFYMILVVLGIITAAIIFLLTLCFCCSYCCRQPVSSRGSSKDALTAHDDGEFREYLHAEPTEIGSLRKEREFARRTRTAQIV
ncbi:hypothetical protein WR25_15805 [Diploscapter pachys]|uniref:Uncharacterized protein n=1 Tax=Diploscapter pachys TaxID=2018661 RepID=A0A2A2L8L5_9BILA|nr:hypothetical protein WR25_15805 [Diploscapter pachys]